MARIGLPELIVVFVFVIGGAVAAVIPFWQISKKASYHPALGILSAIPLVNVVFFYFLAFAEWPATKDLARFRSQPQGPDRGGV
jgi:hypothetical protein